MKKQDKLHLTHLGNNLTQFPNIKKLHQVMNDNFIFKKCRQLERINKKGNKI